MAVNAHLNRALSKRESTRAAIDELLERTKSAVPNKLAPVLPPASHGAPQWYAFEHSIWGLGEKIRQLFLQFPALRSDAELQIRILAIAVDRRAHRGRQPFVMLLGYKSCVRHAARLAKELDDPSVNGHVLSTLYKMKVHGFSAQVELFAADELTWNRNQAKRYLAWDADA